MPKIKILNREHEVSCGPGEEPKLFELVEKLNSRLHENAKLFRGVSENLLIILTAISMEDQNQDLQSKLDKKLDEATASVENICKLLEK